MQWRSRHSTALLAAILSTSSSSALDRYWGKKKTKKRRVWFKLRWALLVNPAPAPGKAASTLALVGWMSPVVPGSPGHSPGAAGLREAVQEGDC